MKLTPDIIRNLIKEEIESLQEFQPGERDFTNPITKEMVKIPVETLARGLAAQCKNIKHALDAVVQKAQDLIDEHHAEAEDDTKASNSFTSGFSTATANRKEKQWTPKQHRDQEKLVRKLKKKAKPGQDLSDLHAIAGAAVNRKKKK